MKKILFLFGILTPFIMLAQSVQVSVEDAQNLLADQAILVDVRENDEVAELAFLSEGMIQIPISELATRYKELPQDKTLIIACKNGLRSQKAIDQLTKLGIAKTLNLEGGITAWQGKGFPVIVDGIAPASKTCCAKGSSEGKACCGGKSKSGEKACDSKESKKCCSDKKS